MSQVQFSQKTSLNKEEIKTLLKDYFIPNERVVIKLHFGEPGNKTAFHPKDIKPYTDALKELEYDFIMVDTPVAYPSPRNTKEGYEKAIKERGYGDLGKYTISDKYIDSEVDGLTFEVARELAEAKNVLVISHVKGHECAGFGGAIKNLGMGALSVKSKSFIHGESKPIVDKEKCIGCGICAKVCPAKAIEILNGKATPNWSKCWGCSICEIACPHGAMKPKLKTFDELLAMGAVSAMKLMPSNTFYFNIIKNITKACDCESNSGEILASDIGTLCSENPVALDNACLELIREKEDKNVFINANNKDPKLQINFAEKYSKFSTIYELEKQC